MQRNTENRLPVVTKALTGLGGGAFLCGTAGLDVLSAGGSIKERYFRGKALSCQRFLC